MTMTMNALQREVITPLPAGGLFSERELNVASEMAVEWERRLISTGANPTESETRYVANLFLKWQETRTIDKPVIIAAPPAFGKSTMLGVFLRNMCRRDHGQFSAIVVKERVADVQALVDEINGGVLEGKYAYAIRGYDKETMTREEYSEQFNEFVYYNVVVMTTKQFELQTMKKNLSKFTAFTNAYSKSYPRRLLLIDEKPALVLNHSLTTREINAFMADVQEASQQCNRKTPAYYIKTLDLVNEIRTILERGEELPGKRLKAIKPGYRVPRQMEQDFSKTHGHERLSILRAFEYIVGFGGVFDVKRAIATISVTQAVHYQYTLFNTFILDGTGSKDPDYMTNDFYLTMPSEMPTYENVTFHVCNTYNLSRTALDKTPEKLQGVADMIRDIARKKESPTLVVTYKTHKDALAKLLEGENVIMKHFDGGRGSNAYTAADTAIYVGNLFKGTSYYSATTQEIAGTRLGAEIDASYDSSSTGITFREGIVNEYRDLDMAVNMVQETNRLRASRKQQDVDIYIFTKYDAMLKHLVEAYPGAKRCEYAPIQRLSGKETSVDTIIKYFAEMPDGSKVKGSSIYKALGFSSKTLKRALEESRVIEAMQLYGIIKEKTSFVKQGER